MDKVGRSHSPDPIQEHLREDKAQANKRISEFIKALIALKKALNGRPVAELSLGQGSIKEPLSEVVPALADRLSGEYSDITNELKRIIQEQEQYSHDRKHSQEEHSKIASLDDNLIKEASNLFTRLWSYVKTPGQFSDKNRWDRKNMLQSAAQLERELGQIGIALVSSDENSVPDAVYGSKTLYNLFQHNLVRPLLAILSESKSSEAIPTPEEPGAPLAAVLPPEFGLGTSHEDLISLITDMQKDVKSKIIPDVQKVVTYLTLNKKKIEPSVLVPLQELIIDLESLIPTFFVSIEKREDIDKIKSQYDLIKSKTELVIESAKNFEELEKNANYIEHPELIALAKGDLRRWFGRRKLELFRQQDHKLRLDADQMVSTAEQKLDALMNILEQKSADISKMAVITTEFGLTLAELFKVIVKLGHIHNSEVKLEKLKARNNGEKFIETNTISEIDLRYLDRSCEKLNELRRIGKN